jgi:hypothetical protein
VHIIVNHLPIQEGADWTEMAAKIDEFDATARAKVADYRGIALLRVSDTEAILLVRFTNRQVLDEASSKIAAPWFAENMRGYLAGPAARSVGEVVAGSFGAAA